jgi:hypothetical protein
MDREESMDEDDDEVKECDVSRDESSQCRKTLLPSEEPV